MARVSSWAYYGALIESMETQYVNGFAYNTMHPVSEDEIPQRFARAEVVWEQKVWREQLQEWDETAKPAAIKVHRELQSVDREWSLRRGVGRIPDPLPGAPRPHDVPAHAIHGFGDAAGG